MTGRRIRPHQILMMTWHFDMTRSRRKTPIYGFTSCDSEKQDKRIWHGRMRARERDALAKANFEEHLTTLRDQASSTWEMDKDGKYYWPAADQERVAGEISGRKGNTPEERAALKRRLLRKWAGK